MTWKPGKYRGGQEDEMKGNLRFIFLLLLQSSVKCCIISSNWSFGFSFHSRELLKGERGRWGRICPLLMKNVERDSNRRTYESEKGDIRESFRSFTSPYHWLFIEWQIIALLMPRDSLSIFLFFLSLSPPLPFRPCQILRHQQFLIPHWFTESFFKRKRNQPVTIPWGEQQLLSASFNY